MSLNPHVGLIQDEGAIPLRLHQIRGIEIDKKLKVSVNNNPNKWCKSCDKIKLLLEFPISDKGIMSTMCRMCRSNKHRKSKYGLTAEQFYEMLQGQNWLCAGCGRSLKLVVDHCHISGKVRGLLCSPCNTSLGMLEENVKYFQGLIEYIKGFK